MVWPEWWPTEDMLTPAPLELIEPPIPPIFREIWGTKKLIEGEINFRFKAELLHLLQVRPNKHYNHNKCSIRLTEMLELSIL